MGVSHEVLGSLFCVTYGLGSGDVVVRKLTSVFLLLLMVIILRKIDGNNMDGKFPPRLLARPPCFGLRAANSM